MSTPEPLVTWRPRLTVRLRMTLSYAGLLVIAGAVVAVVIYGVMRYVPNYPLTAANPRDQTPVPTRGELLDTIVTLSAYALVFLAIVGMAGGWYLAGRMLRPLQEITLAARRAAEGSLDHRIGLTGIKDEFTDLSDTFDEMLDRLQRSFEQYRRFAANASHELRTPHAVMKTMLEVAIADPEHQDVRELARRLQETNQRGIDLVEALLTLASVDNRAVELDPLDLATTARQAVDELRAEAASAGITVTADLEETLVMGNEVLVHQLVTNLGQNGIRHNTGPGGTLSVSTRDHRLVVANTGPVVTPQQAGTLTEPFAKTTGRHTGSHGLGLALVDRIVATHHGRLTLTPNPTGGLTVTAELPAAKL
ncbi:sensor histidine kinase [Kribbella sp. CA-253562]|uniref:sensor histidine kinase n=1 Tax=Kribbella sp. CA-253562 TaxID=3239942 RepID=UPI003D91BB33